jgi:predicted metal-binding membrane protein
MPAVAAIAVGAWGVLVAGDLLGYAWLVEHDVLFETGTLPPLVAVPVFLAAWQLMTAAMMLPTALPTAALFARASRAQQRHRLALAAFLAGYFVVWTAFAVAALAGDAGVHTVVDAWPWLHSHPQLVTGGVLLAAGAGQLTGLTERCLDACRNPLQTLFRYYERGVAAAWRLGVRHGAFCLGCCWPLMLVAFGIGVGSIPLMLLLAAVMLAAKTSSGGHRLVRPAGTALVGGGTLLIAITLVP